MYLVDEQPEVLAALEIDHELLVPGWLQGLRLHFRSHHPEEVTVGVHLKTVKLNLTTGKCYR